MSKNVEFPELKSKSELPGNGNRSIILYLYNQGRNKLSNSSSVGFSTLSAHFLEKLLNLL